MLLSSLARSFNSRSTAAADLSSPLMEDTMLKSVLFITFLLAGAAVAKAETTERPGRDEVETHVRSIFGRQARLSWSPRGG